MGRRAKFTEDDFLDAALRLVASGGVRAATVSAITSTLGAPSGSVYHRFASMELLLATLWIRSVRRYHVGLIAALDADDTIAAALHMVRWSREHLDEATVLLLYRAEELAATWPDELGEQLDTLNSAAIAASIAHGERRYRRSDKAFRERLALAIADIPFAVCRRHLVHGNPPPPDADDVVADLCQHLLGSIPQEDT